MIMENKKPNFTNDGNSLTYKDYKEKALKNPDVKKEYEKLQQEYSNIQSMINANFSDNE
jgi:hypothetical protein